MSRCFLGLLLLSTPVWGDDDENHRREGDTVVGEATGYSSEVSASWNLDLSAGYSSGPANNIVMNGAAILIWKTRDDWSDDEFRVTFSDWSNSNNILYDSGTIESRNWNGNSASAGSLSPSGLYDVRITCTNSWYDCEGYFDWKVVDCGCPSSYPIKLGDCYVDNNNLFNSRANRCRDETVSSHTVQGDWVWRVESGPNPTIAVTYGTSTSDGFTSTTTQARNFGVSISAGISIDGLSAGATMSASESNTIANGVSSILTTSQSETFGVSCGPGTWFIWQWRFDQPADSNPGFNSLTKNFECTKSQNTKPKCPLGFCVEGTECQICNGDYADLSASTAAPSRAPVSTETTVAAPPSSCFSGGTLVELEDGQPVALRAVPVGAKVKVDVDVPKYEVIYGFGHHEESLMGDYLRIGWKRSSDSPSFLETSNDHMLLVNSDSAKNSGFRMIPAHQVEIGDRLKMQAGEVQVDSISKTRAQGLYAPLTYSGTIVVNGIQASQYISVQGEDHLVLGGFIHLPFNYQWLTHALLLPVRFLAPLLKTDDPRRMQPFMLGLIDAAQSVLAWPTLVLLPVTALFLFCMTVGSIVESGVLAVMEYTNPVVLGLIVVMAVLIRRYYQFKVSMGVNNKMKAA
ncbi:Intercellular signal essential for a variety of patterning events during development (By similarity) [Seminavis robusta]|uniref:Intercellular signal essential for a variety of patterning events during development By similarity n=1 Tax=Seminavis robusta TaxID=568900 RepID=A0A9N8DXJ8_9STRA|nr:Intercellular signal essential for a variety of patterning events during development (By similarity) [Seminavis robusta]|eukprot:Sro452_g145970.1 Intercellular signal essential for a variety of patterning events during development (By similarity) (630) ;mRNA; r:54983-56872